MFWKRRRQKTPNLFSASRLFRKLAYFYPGLLLVELYSFRRCPYAMRARLAILLSGSKVLLREVHLKDKPQTLIDLSSKATVPVLVDGERVIDESLAIMEWTLNEKPWCERSKIDYDIITYNDHVFKSHLDAYKYPVDQDSAEENRTEGSLFLKRINDCLSKSNFLHGDYLGFEDVAILPFVRQFANVDRTWFNTNVGPKIQAWLMAFETSALFSQAMVKYPKWEIYQPPMTFPLQENCKLDAYTTKRILHRLCSNFGVCIPASATQSLVNAPPQNIDFFLIRVFVAQGLLPTLTSHLYKTLRREVLSFLANA